MTTWRWRDAWCPFDSDRRLCASSVCLGVAGRRAESREMSSTTVGYGDVVLPRDWRILGASEAAAGILLFGWSIALLIVLIQRTMKELI